VAAYWQTVTAGLRTVVTSPPEGAAWSCIAHKRQQLVSA
jgi:hypothetical protein